VVRVASWLLLCHNDVSVNNKPITSFIYTCKFQGHVLVILDIVALNNKPITSFIYCYVVLPHSNYMYLQSSRYHNNVTVVVCIKMQKAATLLRWFSCVDSSLSLLHNCRR
jgi:hypothetical protein